MIIWRISSHADLRGLGGLYASGRWHTRGQPIVYLAETPSSALLEVLVHLEVRANQLPLGYQLLKVEVPEQVRVDDTSCRSLSKSWISDESETQKVGDNWLLKRKTALLQVPSALAPDTWNWILNPRHPDAHLVKIVRSSRYAFDPRLLMRAR